MKQKTYIQFSSDRNSFIITKKAYIDFFSENDLRTKISHIRNAMDKTSKKTYDTIQNLILEIPFSEKFIEEIFAAYSLLGGLLKDANVTLKIPEFSASTVHFQTIHGEATLLLEIKNLWASLFDKQSFETNYHLQKNGFAIIVEKKDKVISSSHLTQPDVPEKTFDETAAPFTATKIYTTIPQLDLAVELAKRHVDGIGQLEIGSIYQLLGIHPKEAIKSNKKTEYIDKIVSSISPAVQAFSPRPVLCKLSDLDTNVYKQLKGGAAFESTEYNPALGIRGTLRHLHDPELFSLELEAMRRVREATDCKNLSLLLPFVRTVEELHEVKKKINDAGLYRSPSFKIWMTVEIPSNVMLLEKFIEEGIDGIVIDLDDLTMLMVGIDTTDALAKEYTHENDAVKWAIEHTISVAQRHHVASSLFTTQTPFPSHLLEQVIQLGITSVVVHPDEIEATRTFVSDIEKMLLQHE